MKKTKTIVFYVFLGYNLILFLSTLYIEAKQNDLGFLLEMKSYISFFKYFTFFGLLMYLFSYFLIQRDSAKLSKEIGKEKEEITALKAKLFDYQEKNREDSNPSPKLSESNPAKSTDSDSTSQG